MIVTESTYAGKRVLMLKTTEDSRWPMSFGISKARMIVEAYEDIKKWVENYDNTQPVPAKTEEVIKVEEAPKTETKKDDLPF